MDFLRLSEIPQYLDACSSDYRPLAEVLIACGLRISEALQLSWAQVDFDNSVLLVTGSRKLDQGSVEVRGGTKGDRFRGVEFVPRVKGLLRDLRARQAEHGIGEPAARMVFVGARWGASRPTQDLTRRSQARTARRRPPQLAAPPRSETHRGGLLARRWPAAYLRSATARPRVDHHH